jgi:hypothetical protein
MSITSEKQDASEIQFIVTIQIYFSLDPLTGRFIDTWHANSSFPTFTFTTFPIVLC